MSDRREHRRGRGGGRGGRALAHRRAIASRGEGLLPKRGAPRLTLELKMSSGEPFLGTETHTRMKPNRCLGIVALASLLACSGEVTDSRDEENTSAVMEAIIGGVPASATYPEAVLLNMKSTGGLGYSCSATLIAPKVVLTAGALRGWHGLVGGLCRYELPEVVEGETYDWAENGATTVNPAHHDIGLVYLTEAITLASYPVLAQAKQPTARRRSPSVACSTARSRIASTTRPSR